MKLLFCFGTRPEAIKLIPVAMACARRKGMAVRVCVTSQHREMLLPFLDFFGVRPDFDLGIMTPGQTLFGVTARALAGLERVMGEAAPDVVFVQGDATSAMVGALAAFYAKAKVAHVEAGLRSGRRYSPFPEEMNRQLVARLADWHFAPTPGAARNLRREGIREGVHVVGNTVIDALLWAAARIEGDAALRARLDAELEAAAPGTGGAAARGEKIVLVTAHRRESFGRPFARMCRALRRVARERPDARIVYPVHLNPNVRAAVFPLLGGLANVHLTPPLGYPAFVRLLSRCSFVMTDSGGVQEEAPSLGKPVLVLREVTERVEGIAAGGARLVGTDPAAIAAHARELLDGGAAYRRMARARNPYGDGASAGRIAAIVAAGRARRGGA